MGSELGQTNMKHESVPTNKWEFGLLLHTKLMDQTFLGGDPWLLC